MTIQRNVILAIIGTCLLAICGCNVILVESPTRPSAHAPVRDYHARHQYHYYPQEQVYFDPVRRVYFYQDGRNWRMVSTPPRWIQLNQSDYVAIDMEHDEPFREFERHRTMYPRRSHDARQPRLVATPPPHGHHDKHVYRYYPREQVYFDPGRKVYFYQDGRNWRAASQMPKRMRFNQSDYVPVEIDHDEPYREFEKHRTMYPRERHDARQPRMSPPEIEREKPRRDARDGIRSPQERQVERHPETPPGLERENPNRDARNRTGPPQGKQGERQPKMAPPEITREKPQRQFGVLGTITSKRSPEERQPKVAPPATGHENPGRDSMDRTGSLQGKQGERQPKMAPLEKEGNKPDRKFAGHGTVDSKESQEENPKMTASDMEPENPDGEEEKKAMDPKHMNKKNNKKKKKY